MLFYLFVFNNKEPDKYKPENQKWSKIDQKRNCKETPVICPVCLERLGKHYLGHKDIYLVSARQTEKEIGADIVVKHCHFTSDMDIGRNCWCVVEKVMIPKESLQQKWVLHYDSLPDWISDKLQ